MLKRLMLVAVVSTLAACASEQPGADPVQARTPDGFRNAAVTVSVAAGTAVVLCVFDAFHLCDGGNSSAGVTGGSTTGTTGTTGTTK